jgi:hypothetical protein
VADCPVYLTGSANEIHERVEGGMPVERCVQR